MSRTVKSHTGLDLYSGQAYATTLPLTSKVAEPAFANKHDFRPSVIACQGHASRGSDRRSPMRLGKREAEANQQSADKRCRIRDGRKELDQLRLDARQSIGPGDKVEWQTDIAATVPASTAEAIRQCLSKEGWGLDVGLSAPFWRADKVFVDCCVQIPPSLAAESLRIFSVVSRYANLFRTDPPWVRPSEEEADDDEEGEKDWEAEEGNVDEDIEEPDGLEVWDT